MTYRSPVAVKHSEQAALACASAIHAETTAQAIWWNAIARTHAALAEQIEREFPA